MPTFLSRLRSFFSGRDEEQNVYNTIDPGTIPPATPEESASIPDFVHEWVNNQSGRTHPETDSPAEIFKASLAEDWARQLDAGMPEDLVNSYFLGRIEQFNELGPNLGLGTVDYDDIRHRANNRLDAIQMARELSRDEHLEAAPDDDAPEDEEAIERERAQYAAAMDFISLQLAFEELQQHHEVELEQLENDTSRDTSPAIAQLNAKYDAKYAAIAAEVATRFAEKLDDHPEFSQAIPAHVRNREKTPAKQDDVAHDPLLELANSPANARGRGR